MPTTRRRYLGSCGSVAGVVCVGALGGCARSESRVSSDTTVRIGSKPFAEQRILGYLAYERLRDVTDLRVVDEIGYGNSLTNWNATAAGEQHLYWEYTGTAWSALPPRHDERISDPTRLFTRVQSDARERGLRLAEPASFSNEYVVVTDRAWAERSDVSTLTDLVETTLDRPQEIGVAVNEEFYHRDDGWDHLLEFYGVDDDSRAALEFDEFIVTSIGLTYELLERDGINVASGFATDPQLDRPELTTVTDDREFFIPYQPTPVAHAPLLDEQPEIFEVLSPVVDALDESTIRDLNRRVLIDGRNPNTVATSFLDQLGGTNG